MVTTQAIINLALMTGNIGRPGTGANSITGQCHAMGSRVFSNTTGLYGGREYDNEARRKAVGEAIGVDPEILPKKPTLPYNVIIDKINSGEIKALWVIATNPIISWINNLEFKKAAEKLEFLVVQDIYKDTETSEYCHLMIPSTSGLKKEGVLINTERRLSKLNPVLSKGENELSDYDIFLGIGEALGMGSLLDNWRTPKDAFNALVRCTKGMPCDVSKDDHVYSRCILHHYIDGRRDIEALDFTPNDIFNMYNIKWIKGVEVISMNPKEHTIALDNGEELYYEKVLLAAGSSSTSIITGRNPIWPTAVKEGIIAAGNMAGMECYMEDFFGSKNTMNFAGLATMSLGIVVKPDDSYEETIEINGEYYKKIIHKNGIIYGAVVQGDLSYVGVLNQLIKEKIDVRKVKKPLFEIDYSDFFNIKENLEFVY